MDAADRRRKQDTDMPLWILKPVDASDRNWAASTYNGDVVIRAADMRRARRLASLSYALATNHKPGETIRSVPWTQADLVDANQVNATKDYAEEGDEGIVWPVKAIQSANPG